MDIRDFSFWCHEIWNEQLLALAFLWPSYLWPSYLILTFLLIRNTKVTAEYIFVELGTRSWEIWLPKTQHCPCSCRKFSCNCSFPLLWGHLRQLLCPLLSWFSETLKINHFTSSHHNTSDQIRHVEHDIVKYEENEHHLFFKSRYPKQKGEKKKNTDKKNSANYKNPHMACLTSDKRHIFIPLSRFQLVKQSLDTNKTTIYRH